MARTLGTVRGKGSILEPNHALWSLIQVRQRLDFDSLAELATLSHSSSATADAREPLLEAALIAKAMEALRLTAIAGADVLGVG